MPHQNLCQDEEDVPANYIAGTPYVGVEHQDVRRAGRSSRGVFGVGSSCAARGVGDPGKLSGVERRARHRGRRGVLRHHGGLVQSRRCRSGKALWQFKAGSGIVGQPVSYRGPDGKQYVAVLAGVGGWAGAVVAGDLDTRDGSAALGSPTP